jgi:mRNA interferase RelE/StbE
MYQIVLRNNAKRFLEKLSKDHYHRFSKAIHKLAQNPLSGDVKKLHGDIPGAYRLRIGKWRVLFVKNDDARFIDIVIIDKRGDIY